MQLAGEWSVGVQFRRRRGESDEPELRFHCALHPHFALQDSVPTLPLTGQSRSAAGQQNLTTATHYCHIKMAQRSSDRLIISEKSAGGEELRISVKPRKAAITRLKIDLPLSKLSSPASKARA